MQNVLKHSDVSLSVSICLRVVVVVFLSGYKCICKHTHAHVSMKMLYALVGVCVFFTHIGATLDGTQYTYPVNLCERCCLKDYDTK